MPKVLLITTGGTIASVRREGLQGASPALTAQELLASVLGIEEVASVETYAFSNIPGHYMSLQQLLELSRLVQGIGDSGSYDGVTITMGTNALEEAAYFMDLVVDTEMPIVITGAMRNPSLLSPDGPINIYNAILSASSRELKGMGVLVCFNNELHTARDVSKTNTLSVAAFTSPGLGPIARLRKRGVVVYRRPTIREKIKVSKVDKRVEIIRSTAGMDGKLMNAAIDLGSHGIVLEAYGAGHVHPDVVPSIERAVSMGIPVVITPRTGEGEMLEDTYGFIGGEIHLKRIGAIFASGLSGLKARIKLILALSAEMGMEEVRRLFEG